MLTFEFRLRPNTQQDALLWAALKSSRELYNQALRELIDHYEMTGKHMSLFSQDRFHGKAQHPGMPAVLVDTTLKRLHVAFGSFFRRCRNGATKKGFPRFKSANRWNSIQFRDAASNGIAGNYFKAGRNTPLGFSGRGGDSNGKLQRSEKPAVYGGRSHAPGSPVILAPL